MKNKIFALVISVVLITVMECPAFAAAEDVPFSTMVLDDAGLLTQSELDELDARAWEITHTYECAVYIVTTDSTDGMDAIPYTEYIQEKYGMGYGSDQSCVILMLSMENRDYNLMARGYGNTAFTDYGKDKLADSFLDEFGNDDWYGGFKEYIEGCDQYLKAARDGEPIDKGRSPIVGLALGVAVPLLVAFIYCSKLKSQMFTAVPQRAAKVYIDRQGLVLTKRNDQFINTTRTERRIETKKENKGTTVNSNGNSNKSGKF